jgi:hypothetical protein
VKRTEKQLSEKTLFLETTLIFSFISVFAYTCSLTSMRNSTMTLLDEQVNDLVDLQDQ